MRGEDGGGEGTEEELQQGSGDVCGFRILRESNRMTAIVSVLKMFDRRGTGRPPKDTNGGRSCGCEGRQPETASSEQQS